MEQEKSIRQKLICVGVLLLHYLSIRRLIVVGSKYLNARAGRDWLLKRLLYNQFNGITLKSEPTDPEMFANDSSAACVKQFMFN